LFLLSTPLTHAKSITCRNQLLELFVGGEEVGPDSLKHRKSAIDKD